jgi:FdhE protein
MTTSHSALDDLKQRRPEWQPWLAVVEEVFREATSGSWEATVPPLSSERQPRTPLLANAVLSLRAKSVRRVLERAILVASRDGSPKMGTLRRVLHADLDVLALFAASLSHDVVHIHTVGTGVGVDADALQAVAALLPIPFLQACHRRWTTSISPGWTEGYCPVCGSWPAFAEVRGIERSRFSRCGRCGAEWHSHALRCPYCATNDHDELVSLVPENDGFHAVIEACRRCHGYVKALTRLQGCRPEAVMLEDLASVHFDLAALEQGYTRAQDTGYRLAVTVAERTASRGLLGWIT